MRIVHISPNSSYTEGWSYQENLLPKYQAKLGNEVTLIVTNKSRPNQDLVEVDCGDFISKDGFRVIRKKKIIPKIGRISFLASYLDIYNDLETINPDLIFVHGLGDRTICQVIRYKRKHMDTLIIQDNHLDYNIGFNPNKNFFTALLSCYYKWFYKKTDKYISKVYGVTPWRKKYAMDVYGVPESKAGVLIMGADDEKIDLENKTQIRKNIRERYNIENDEFLIVTGGKLDKSKGVLPLMEACGSTSGLKLLIFGNVLDDIRSEFDSLCKKNKNIIYIGWIDSENTYDYFFAADLVVFLGQHSVLWEQACAAKVPCLFKKWEGMDHVDVGGNCVFLEELSIDGIRNELLKLVFTEEYYKMKKTAESEKTDVFLYSNIADKSLEITKHDS